MNVTWAVVEINPEKNSGLCKSQTHDLCNTGAVLYQPGSWSFCGFVKKPSNMFITNSQNDQLPVGLLALLEEHCTDITDVMGLAHTQAWMFFMLYFHYCSSCVHNCDGHLHLHFLICSSNMWFLYVHTHPYMLTVYLKLFQSRG